MMAPLLSAARRFLLLLSSFVGVCVLEVDDEDDEDEEEEEAEVEEWEEEEEEGEEEEEEEELVSESELRDEIQR